MSIVCNAVIRLRKKARADPTCGFIWIIRFEYTFKKISGIYRKSLFAFYFFRKPAFPRGRFELFGANERKQDLE